MRLLHDLQVSAHNIRLPKQSTVGDVINELKTKVHNFAYYFVCDHVQPLLFMLSCPTTDQANQLTFC
jgi:hypothetical protein